MTASTRATRLRSDRTSISVGRLYAHSRSRPACPGGGDHVGRDRIRCHRFAGGRRRRYRLRRARFTAAVRTRRWEHPGRPAGAAGRAGAVGSAGRVPDPGGPDHGADRPRLGDRAVAAARQLRPVSWPGADSRLSRRATRGHAQRPGPVPGGRPPRHVRAPGVAGRNPAGTGPGDGGRDRRHGLGGRGRSPPDPAPRGRGQGRRIGAGFRGPGRRWHSCSAR